MTSKRISQLVQSDIRAMTRECVKRGGINLGQGLCELPTPEAVVEGVIDALKDNKKNIYSPPEGVFELRQAISGKLKRENKISADPESQVIVTTGATGGYAATLMALFNPGDGILLFEPYYGYHLNAAILAELEPQYIPMSGPQMEVTKEDILKATQDNTKAIVVCTPSNPSGKMYTESELEIIAEVAKEKDLLVITDEMYEYFRYDGQEHVSPASLDSLKDRTISMMGLSKTFSITGWRLGYVSAPEALAEKIKLANDLFYVCAPTPLQYGVAKGFNIGDGYFKDLQSSFQVKRDRFCEALSKAGMEPIVPQGAYYVLADITKFKFSNSKEASMAILDEVGVASVPGRAFFSGDMGEKYIRFNFAVNDDLLDQSIQKILSFRG